MIHDDPRVTVNPIAARLPTVFGEPWRAGCLAVPVFSWGFAGLAALALDLTHPHTRAVIIWGVVATLFLTACGVGASLVEAYHGSMRAWLAGNGLALPAFVTTAAAAGPYHWWVLGAWSAATVASACGYFAARHLQLAHEHDLLNRYGPTDAAPAGPPPVVPPTERQQWEATFTAAGLGGLQFVSRHPTRCGLVLHVRFPRDGSITFTRLVGSAERLETVFGNDRGKFADGLRPGALEFHYAKDAKKRKITTEAYIYVDTADILAETVMLVEDHTPLSITQAFTIGRFASGDPISLSLAEIHTMIVGQTRKGKSNLLHLIIYLITRCDDAVLWAIDFKGGATLRAWLAPWLAHEIDPHTGDILDHPVIDWAAVDRLEAERILTAAKMAAEARPGLRYAPGGMGGTKWRATPETPAIFLLIDELSGGVGSHSGPAMDNPVDGASSSTLMHLLTTLLVLGAGEGVFVCMAGQRATVTMMGSGDGKAQVGMRICLPVMSKGDAADVFESNPSGMRATDVAAGLTEPGSCVIVGRGIDTAQTGRVFMVGDHEAMQELVRRAVLEHTSMTGELDEGTEAAIAPTGYAERWTDPDRTYWLWGKPKPATLRRWIHPDLVMDLPPLATPGGGMRPASSTAARLGLADVPGWTTTPAAPEPVPAPAVPDGPDDGGLTADEMSRWEQLADAYENEQPTAEPAGQATGSRALVDNPAYQRFLQIIDAAGARGITIPAVYAQLRADGLAPGDQKTLYTWRDKAVTAGLVFCPNRSTLYARRHFHSGGVAA